MRKFNALFKISAAIVAGTVFFLESQESGFSQTIKTDLSVVKVEKIFSGLNTPWAMAMLPNGELLVTERSGNMVVLDPVSPKKKRIVRRVPKVAASGQGGLLDVILDKDFESNRTIYFTYSVAETRRKLGTALARAELTAGSKPQLENLQVLYSMPQKNSSGRHFGSRIVQSSDGTLFFTIGDRGTQPRAQDPFDPAGSVMRINPDGSIPKDNPFVDGTSALPEVWSIGHRNPQGATLNPYTGDLWTISHGARGGDEINIPEAGKNYGWPKISYGVNYSGTQIGVGTAQEGLEQPIYYWDPSIAPSGADFYEGTQIPQWTGNLFVGALRGQALIRLSVDGNQITGEERLFEDDLGRIRDVRNMPDGALWIATNDGDGSIYRISDD